MERSAGGKGEVIWKGLDEKAAHLASCVFAAVS